MWCKVRMARVLGLHSADRGSLSLWEGNLVVAGFVWDELTFPGECVYTTRRHDWPGEGRHDSGRLERPTPASGRRVLTLTLTTAIFTAKTNVILRKCFDVKHAKITVSCPWISWNVISFLFPKNIFVLHVLVKWRNTSSEEIQIQKCVSAGKLLWSFAS